jgi:membrane dipeptidase
MENEDHENQVAKIHRGLPVVDGHNDLPWAIRVRGSGDLSIVDPSRFLEGFHTDGPRLRSGGVGAQFWSVFVPAWDVDPFQAVNAQIDLVEAMIANDPEYLQAGASAAEVLAIATDGRTASLVGAEGGHAIENDLGKLRLLRERGVRYMTLTHADANDWADSATDEPRHGGLTRFGREVVAEMNDIGMIIDISHVSDETMRDAIELSERPIMASHSGARAIASHVRNVPDDVLEAVALNGGVVMVNFYPPFVVESSAQQMTDMFTVARRLRPRFDSDEEFEEELDRLRANLSIDRGTVSNVVDHIEHIVTVSGIDHVGLGSDFDGMDMTPVGLEDVSCYPSITRELLKRGWAEADITKVLGENALRVLSAND